MPRFVLLLHDCPNDRPRPTHCDLMLEAGDVLATWSFAALPRDWSRVEGIAISDSNSVAAERLADHRLAYLDYEGPLSGDRGSVSRLDAGTFATIAQSPADWSLQIIGQSIRGQLDLQQSAADPSQWQLTFRQT